MFGNGESSVAIVLAVIVAFHRAEVLAESVCEPTTSLPNVQNLTAGTNDGINDTGRGTAMASFEVYDSVRVVDIGSPSSEGKCSSLFLVRV